MVCTAVGAVVMSLLLSCGGDNQQPPTDPNPIASPPAPPPPPGPGPDVVVSVDAGQRFQTIEGFGTSMRVFSDPHLILLPTGPDNVLRIPEAAQRQVLDSLYIGIGLTRVRVVPTPGVEPVNDNADPSSTDLSKFDFSGLKNDAFFPAIREARLRGVTTWWSSPVVLESWMNPGNPEENVEWAMAILRRWRNEGLEFSYYSVINEPSYFRSGGPWPPEYIRDVVILLGRRLKAEGFRTRIVIPDDFNAGFAAGIARVILADPEARSYVGALPFHLYGAGLSETPKLRVLSEQYGIPMWMSEHYVANAMDWGLSVNDLLVDYNVTAVDYLFGFFGEASQAQLISLLHRGTEYVGIKMEPHFHVFGHFSKYVRPGAVRVATTVSAPGIKVSAFVREGRMSIVAINPGTTPRTVRFNLTSHGNTARFSVVRTLPGSGGTGERLKPQTALAVETNSIVAVLEPQSISTLFQ